MIFVTIGTQEPFDRLIKAMDAIAATIDEPVIAQVFNSEYKIRHMQTYGFLSPAEFDRLFQEARLIVGHAGMGTIITALTTSKPIVVMPRVAAKGEHRNEHQLATAAKFKELGYIKVAEDESELSEILTTLLLEKDIESLHKLNNYASSTLIASISNFIKENK